MKRIVAVLAGLALFGVDGLEAAGLGANSDSASTSVRAYMPLICGAEITGFRVVSGEPLVVDATVRQACNGDHEFTVSYDPHSVSNTNQLSLDYDGRLPTHATLGSAGFGNEHHVDSVRALHIVYAGGTVEQRDQFAHTIAIAVAPR
jgi:hypothetical protein